MTPAACVRSRRAPISAHAFGHRARPGALALLVAVGGCDWLGRESAPEPPRSADTTGPSTPASASAPPRSLSAPDAPPAGTLAEAPRGAPNSFAVLVKRSNPAVATVRAVVEHENLFGKRVRRPEGIGTAFVYDASGLLLTNHHVVAEAAEITVGFSDGREMRATVVGSDKPTDVAVLRVDAAGLVALPLGDSDAIEVGDWVVAIGNPFGLEHTVSAGILSGKGRTRDDVKGLDPSGYFNFLQTDASINPGNSGGPLINLAGQVVGINSAVRANANGIGFAIPINMVRQLVPMLVADGRVRRSAIGVYVESPPSDPASRASQGQPRGAVVKQVIAGGPADRAGLAVGDVIVAFEGKPVADPNELRWLASIAGVKKTVTLRIVRGARSFDTQLTLSELPEAQE